MRIGVVSDTHGYFDPHLPRLLHGVDEILHAGDVGSVAMLDQLRAFAPVQAVRGNVDSAALGLAPALTRRFGAVEIHMFHEPPKPQSELRDWAQAGPSVLSEAENGTTSHHPGGAGHEPKGQFGPDRPVLLARPLGCPCGSDAVASWVRVAPLDPWRVDSYSGDAARLYLEPPRGSPLPGPPCWCPGLERNRGIDRLFLAGQPLLNKATAPGRSLKAGC